MVEHSHKYSLRGTGEEKLGWEKSLLVGDSLDDRGCKGMVEAWRHMPPRPEEIFGDTESHWSKFLA
jgi:hypothetical protein